MRCPASRKAARRCRFRNFQTPGYTSSYLLQAGERNRGLSIIKSRGTTHSNQARKLTLSNTGVTLTDTCTAGGEVRVKSLQTELLAKQVEKELLVCTTESHRRELSRGRPQMEELRGADAAKPGQK